MSDQKLYKQLTNLRTYIPSAILAVVGILLLTFADFLDWKNHLSFQSLTRDIGSLLIASVAVATVWELFSKRAFFAEALAISKLADELNVTRLTGLSAHWQGSVDWSNLFRSARNIKIFFAYGRTWRNTYLADLTSFAMRPNTKATIVLPDPSDKSVMISITQRMGIDPDDLSKRISEATQEFIDIFKKSGKEKEKLEIWYIPFAPTYSYYCFGEKAVFTLYHHKAERADCPTFTIEQGGSLYDFFEDDFENLVKQEMPRAKKVFPA